MGFDVGALINGSTLVIETTAGTYRMELSGLGEGPPNPVLTLLKPRVSVVHASAGQLFSVAPYGEPRGAPPWGLIVGLTAALGLAFLLWRAVR